MRTENDIERNDASPTVDVIDESQEDTLRWLLDMDMDDPAEGLFTLDQEEYIDTGLTEYEAEVARRPMTRGRTDADDYATYVEEEIVISSDAASGDIYSTEPAPVEHAAAEESSAATGEMAIDYSRKSPGQTTGPGNGLEEGEDVLGLSEDDDMGEKFLVLKRVKPEAAAAAGTCSGSAEPPATPSADEHESASRGDAQVPADQIEAPTDATTTSDSSERGEPRVPNKSNDSPVLRLVTTGESVEEVNDEASAATAEIPGEAQTAGSGEAGAFVSLIAPPADEQEFDDYLVEGSAPPTDAADIDQLVFAYNEGSDPDSPTADDSIDYHEDFTAMAGFGGDSLAIITPLIPQLMAEVSELVGKRLVELGLAADAVQPELVLGGDAESVARWQAEGYQPVISICSHPPAILQQLLQAEVDEIYLRLIHSQTGQRWNELFMGDFVAPDSPMQPEPAAEAGLVEQVLDSAQNLAPDPQEPSEFAQDLLAIDLEDELAGAGWEPGSGDIDDIFDDLGGFAADGEADEVLTPPAAEPEVDDADNLQVFEENIFAADIVGELAASEEPATDIDALFDSFGQESDDAGDVCGLDVDEFVEAQPAAQSLPASDGDDEVEPETVQPAQSGQAWSIPEGIAFNRASQTSTEIFTDFLDAFIEEGSSELEKLEDAIGGWEKDINSESAYTAVTRTLHTIKGIAKGVGLQFYGTLIHNFETLLEAMPRPEAGAEAGYFRIVNVWLDAAVRGLDHVQNLRSDIASEFPQQPGVSPATEKQASPARHEPASETSADVGSTAAEPEPLVQPVDARQKQQSKQLADEGARVLAAQQSVRITSDKLDHLLNLSNQAQQLGVRTAQSTARGKRAAAEMHSRLSSVRSHIASIADRALRSVNAKRGQDTSELDALEMDQYSELQEAANILREGVEDLADLVDFASRQNVQVEALLNQQATVISSIGAAIRAARVVPVSRLIPGLRRLVRTVSNDLDKTVSLRVLNELGTLDRDDYARCQIILDHMARNALDHGIESAGQREAAGKPSAGQITIDIRKAGADAIITLADDGRGIDPESMRESALRKGLDVDVESLSDEEALRLIFHRGFSTASTVSQISGRGVGMDIVLSELQQMGGDIQIESTVGEGTAFHIRIPSSVTVNGALLVTAAEQSYAIPLGGLVAVEHVPVDDFFQAVERGTWLSLSGMDCEPAYLATLCNGGQFPERSAWKATVPIIIAGSPARYMAIAIDDVEEALELVIRSLGAQFSTVPGVAGAATTADGEAIVALDLNLLVASVDDDDHSSVYMGAAREETLLAMVVDDSRTQRMVATSQLETVGVETVTAENGGVAMDLLNTADRLPDIILLDVEMPVKDGIQTLREIRKSVRYSHIPVIMVTSRTGIKHRSLAEQAGCNGYMGKPFNFSLLIGQINELTGHRLQLT